MKKRLFTLLLAALMLFSILAACAPTEADTSPQDTPAPSDTTEEPGEELTPAGGYGRTPWVAPELVTELPRNETLFFGGVMWEPVGAWADFHGATLNFAIDQVGHGSRAVIFETLYMYNAMTDTFHPLLADGDFEWNDDMSEMTVRIKPAAYWSDGTKVTAHDVAFTWYFGFYAPGANGEWVAFIDDIVAIDDDTVVIHATMQDGIPVFARQIERYVGQTYVLQKAWLENVIERNSDEDGNPDPAQISVDRGEDFVWSGPFTRHFYDDTRNVLIRDDDYWGQHESMWGRLPTPRFLVSLRHANNDAIAAALAAGDIDISQAYIANINLMWEDQGLPVSTFMDRAPFGVTANMPTAHFNMTIPILRDHVEIRQAIAWATDFDAINANAMTFQSESFRDVPRSLFSPFASEQVLFDSAAVAELQFQGGEADRANELLDETGLFPRGDDGWRTYNGERISFTASCPTGWSDWEAALEIVAAAGEAIGIEITTNFVSEGEFYDNVTAGPPNPDSFDIFIMWTPSISRVSAWDRARWLLSDERIDSWPHNWAGANYSMYSNPRATELINMIPQEADESRLREIYTELVEIYLTDVPSFSLMYRPALFHAVNESVWTGFTEYGDGRNVPPFIALNGYAIADLFNIRLVEP